MMFGSNAVAVHLHNIRHNVAGNKTKYVICNNQKYLRNASNECRRLQSYVFALCNAQNDTFG